MLFKAIFPSKEQAILRVIYGFLFVTLEKKPLYKKIESSFIKFSKTSILLFFNIFIPLPDVLGSKSSQLIKTLDIPVLEISSAQEVPEIFLCAQGSKVI